MHLNLLRHSRGLDVVEKLLVSRCFGVGLEVQQFRPDDGATFYRQRGGLERVAAPLIPFVQDEKPLQGLRKINFKLYRSRVPRTAVSPGEWVSLLEHAVRQ